MRREFLARCEAWLGALPPLDQVALADVFHIEQIKGCWAGVIEYGELGRSSARLCPMSAAEIVREALRLPIDYRLGLRLHQDVMGAAWPELLEFPFNDAAPLPRARMRWYAVKEWSARRVGRMTRLIRRVRGRLDVRRAAQQHFTE
jgi:hypothetical protein